MRPLEQGCSAQHDLQEDEGLLHLNDDRDRQVHVMRVHQANSEACKASECAMHSPLPKDLLPCQTSNCQSLSLLQDFRAS